MNPILGTLLALACLLLAGCDSPSPAPEQPAPAVATGAAADAAVPAYGDVFVDSSIADASNLISVLTTDAPSHQVSDLIFDGLVRYDADNRVVGRLARSWQISPDGLEITFQLHEGVRFHDGVELTAEDVAFTYRVIQDPNTLTAYRGDFEAVAAVEVLGPYTLRVRYREPFAPALISWSTHVLPRHLLEGQDINTSALGRQPVGSGPYRFGEWRSGQHIRLERNPDYFATAADGQGRLPYLDGYLYRVIPDQGVQYNELLAEKIDAMRLKPLQWLRQTQGKRFRAAFNKYRYLANGYTYLGYNLQRELFRDVRVRQALSYAIDQEELVRGVLQGLGEVATGPYKPGTWAHNPDVRAYPYDPQRARELLAAAGWRDDGSGVLQREGRAFRFTILTNQGNDQRIKAAEIIQQRLHQVGIQVNIRVLEWAAFINDFVRPGTFDAVLLGWSILPDPDLYDVWHSSKAGPVGLNHTHYANAEVDEMLVRARRTVDREARRKLYHRFQEILAEEQPYTFLFVPYTLEAVHRRVHGPAPAAAGLRYNFSHWYVPRSQQRHRHTP